MENIKKKTLKTSKKPWTCEPYFGVYNVPLLGE